jgi:hypothetical protein
MTASAHGPEIGTGTGSATGSATALQLVAAEVL